MPEIAYEKMFRGSREAKIIACGNTGRILDVSSGFLALTKYNEQELSELGLDHILPSWREGFDPRSGVCPPQTMAIRTILKLKNQGSISVEAHLECQRIPDPHWIATIYPVNETGKPTPFTLEAAFIAESVLENSPDGIVSINERGEISSFNRGAEKILGYSAPEVIGKKINILMPEPYASEHDGYIEMFFKSGNAKIIGKGREVSAKRKDGTVIPIFLNVGNPIHVGAKIYFTGLIRDLSREKHVEAQLRQSQKMEAIGTMAGGIAHDFNNILGGILGYVELLLEDTDSESYQYEDLQEMLKACNRAKALVQQILTFSRQDKPKREVMLLTPVIKESLKLLRATIPTTIDIRTTIQDEPHPVIADATQIHQLMMNLCTNAYYAMRGKAGVLEVHMKRVQIDQDFCEVDHNLPFGAYLMLTIRDTGHGMDQKTISRIFDPFFTTKPIGQGTGMGLAVVHGIVQNHDGGIYVKSRLSYGTKFYVFLPVHQEMEMQQAGESNQPRALKGMNVLLVDDDPVLLRVQTRMLERLGFTVSAFSNGQEAWDYFSKHQVSLDVVISDQTMPKMTGLELAGHIRKLNPNLPFILTTGFSDLVTPDQLEALGVNRLLMKPVQRDELVRTLAEVHTLA